MRVLATLGWSFDVPLPMKKVVVLGAGILWHRRIVVCYKRAHCSMPPLFQRSVKNKRTRETHREDTGNHISHHTHLSLRILHEWREEAMALEEDG